jgi:hypothetical protein
VVRLDIVAAEGQVDGQGALPAVVGHACGRVPVDLDHHLSTRIGQEVSERRLVHLAFDRETEVLHVPSGHGHGICHLDCEVFDFHGVRSSFAFFDVALFDNETSFCRGIPYAEGVSHQSPGSRSAPWDDHQYTTQTPTGFYTIACKTPLGFGFTLFPRPWVRFATLGFVVEPRCGSSHSATS